MKTLEKLVERCIRNQVLLTFPLHKGQHAYQVGCTVKTALHAVGAKLEQQSVLHIVDLWSDSFLFVAPAFSAVIVSVLLLMLISCFRGSFSKYYYGQQTILVNISAMNENLFHRQTHGVPTVVFYVNFSSSLAQFVQKKMVYWKIN